MTELRTPPRTTLPPEFDDEEDVDLGRYWRKVVERWWLLLAGLVAGLVVGYLVSLGSGSVWQASAVVYLGNPLAAGSSNVVQGVQQNPRTVNEIVHSEAAVTSAAAHCGLRPGQIRGGISTKAVTGAKAAAKTGGGQLMQIKVQGDGPRKSACPANVLARRVVDKTSQFVDTKISTLERRLESENAAIASLDRVITTQTAAVNNSAGLSQLDQLVLINQLNNAQLQRAALVNEQGDTEQQLAQARYIEAAQILERAVPKKTTARSSRNSMLVGGILGLLVGVILALVWDRLPTGAARRDA